MSKNSSGKKNPLKKTGRKDYLTDYEPISFIQNKSVTEGQRSNSLTPERNRRQTIPGEIPSILKKNIAALSESTDSIKLTDFGKSFIPDDDKTPPKKKMKSMFDKLQYDDAQNIEIVPSGYENKRLQCIKNFARPPVMFSSPSMLNEFTRVQRSPEQKFPSNSVPTVKPTVVDEFDKLLCSENQQIDSKDNFKEEIVIKDNSKDENAAKENDDKKHSDEEKSVNDSNSSSSHSAMKSAMIDENIIKDYRDSLNGITQIMNSIQKINETIMTFRQELTDGLLGDFPSSLPSDP